MNNLTGTNMIIIATVSSATIAELNQILTYILYGFVVILKKCMMKKMKIKKINCFGNTQAERDLKTRVHTHQSEIATMSCTGL
jgi:hypothetical protein